MTQNHTLLVQKLFTDNSKINHVYTHKITTYGRYVLEERTKHFRLSFKSQKTTSRITDSNEPRDYPQARAKKKIYQIIEANHKAYGRTPSLFVTLTFKKPFKKVQKTIPLIRNFVKRYNRRFDQDLRYILVPEFTKKENVHYHGVFFNVPWVDLRWFQNTVWRYGHLDMKVPKKLRSVTKYVSKYITKEMMATHQKGQRYYFASQNLIFPKYDFTLYHDCDTLKPVQVLNYNRITTTKYICQPIPLLPTKTSLQKQLENSTKLWSFQTAKTPLHSSLKKEPKSQTNTQKETKLPQNLNFTPLKMEKLEYPW